jgi:branched-chain amino acid transport system permease protein
MSKKHTTAVFAVFVLVVLIAPFTSLYPVFLMKLMCMALFACALNLLLGFAGLLSFGHAMFFGTASYAAGYAMKEWGFTPELGLLFGALVGAALGYVVGLLAIRRLGIYFAMITLAFAQMIYFFLLQAKFTGGEDGLQGIPRGKLFGVINLSSDLTLYYFIAFVFILSFLGIYRIVNSPYGQILKAIREHEPRAISMGYDTRRIKLLAFVLSAAFAGLAGAAKTLVLGFATLTDANLHASGEVVLMTLLGGIGTFFGPVVGAVAIVGVQNQLADKAGAWITVILGVLFVACVVSFRRGMVGEIAGFWERRKFLEVKPIIQKVGSRIKG